MATVLIIDDDPEVCEALARILKDHRAVTATDGRDGVRFCQEEKPDLVLLDIVMPGQEGIETIIQIRKSWPDLPIIAMSGGWREFHRDYLNDALSLGANKVLVKPFQAAELRQLIDELL